MPSTAVYVTSNDPRAEANAVLALRRPAGCTLQPLGAFPTHGRELTEPADAVMLAVAPGAHPAGVVALRLDD